MNVLKNVEIFASGTWNGQKYTDKDLDIMVDAFNQKNGVEPFMKLGHDDDQKLLQADGYPAAGWVTSLKRVGTKLLADISDIPDKVYKVINSKGYKKISSEIFWNFSIGDKIYKRVLASVAFLGADIPAVRTLDDIISLYGLDNVKIKAYNSKEIEKYDYEFENNSENQGEDMPEIKELQEKLDESKKNYSELEIKLQEKEDSEKETAKELAELKKFKEEAEQKLIDEKEANRIEKNKNFVDSLAKDGLITPSMKKYVASIIDEKEERKFTYTIKEEGKEDKEETVTTHEALRNIFTLAKKTSDVNFDENSEDGKLESKSEDALDAKIEKFAEDNKISYAEAYKVIKAEQNEDEE